MRLLGTDISSQAVAAASKGLYSSLEIARGLDDSMRSSYFARRENGWQIRDEVRGMATFRTLSLMDDFSFLGRFDIILCRNVASTLPTRDRTQLFHRLERSLEQEGYLMVGAMESLSGICPQFESKRYLRSVYYQVRTPAAVDRTTEVPYGCSAAASIRPNASACSPRFCRAPECRDRTPRRLAEGLLDLLPVARAQGLNHRLVGEGHVRQVLHTRLRSRLTKANSGDRQSFQHVGQRLVVGALPDETMEVQIGLGSLVILVSLDGQFHEPQAALQFGELRRPDKLGGLQRGLHFQRAAQGHSLANVLGCKAHDGGAHVGNARHQPGILQGLQRLPDRGLAYAVLLGQTRFPQWRTRGKGAPKDRGQ